ncbi:MAG: hypothetical protein Q8O42_02490 [Acidobacteriota bacterium]|nr:hypothetical protein [Acidobacteriota bacterium]
MIVLLVLLVTLAGLSLGLRTISVLLPPQAHPLDRMALSIVAGTLWTAVVFETSSSHRVFDLGLGLMLSLSPVGLFDLAKWWFRSRGRRSGWLRVGFAPTWLVALRWLFLAGLLAAVALALIPDYFGRPSWLASTQLV